jgi:hypothetical protein
MIEFKHTPGPWIVYDDWYIRAVDGVGSFATVCAPILPLMTEQEHRANAVLIASAPELLQTLERVRTDLIAELGQWVYRVNFNYIDDAIAKAEGRSP